MDSEQIHELLGADQDELYSVLGAASLAIDVAPSEILRSGRNGEFYATSPAVLGPEIPFDHPGFKKAGREFLRRWGKQIKEAICGNAEVYAADKQKVSKQLDVWVATLVSTLAVNIPELAPFTVVLNLIAIMVTRSGLEAFCKQDL